MKEEFTIFKRNFNTDCYRKGVNVKVPLLYGTYRHYPFLIMTMGTHPTAYIKVPTNHEYYKKYYDGETYDLPVHGGVTYLGDRVSMGDLNGDTPTGWWLGWDYAHYGDYFYSERVEHLIPLGNCKRWTLNEILDEIRGAIRFLQTKENV